MFEFGCNTHGLAGVDESFTLLCDFLPELDLCSELHTKPTGLVEHLAQGDWLVAVDQDGLAFTVLVELLDNIDSVSDRNRIGIVQGHGLAIRLEALDDLGGGLLERLV